MSDLVNFNRSASNNTPIGISPPPPCLRWSAMTHRGKIRPNNEDTFLAMVLDGYGVRYLGKEGEVTSPAPDFIFAVSDGMGGASAGEYASRVTVDQITKLLPRGFRMGAMGMANGHVDLLEELYSTIHRELIALGRCYEELRGMGATLSLCWFSPEWLYFGHIGDSRIYYLPKNGGMIQLTHDHTHAGWLRRNGKINEREARTHPMKNSLLQTLGASNQFLDPQFGSVSYHEGDRFLLCSDGLVDGLWDHSLEEIIRTPSLAQSASSPAPRLIGESLEASGRDNLTAVVVEVLPQPQAPTS